MRARARKEASAQEVRGHHKQFAEARHQEYTSWAGNEVFDLADLRKVKPKKYVTGRWVLTIKTDKKRRRPGEYQEVSRTNRRNISSRILLLPQDPDLG